MSIGALRLASQARLYASTLSAAGGYGWRELFEVRYLFGDHRLHQIQLRCVRVQSSQPQVKTIVRQLGSIAAKTVRVWATRLYGRTGGRIARTSFACPNAISSQLSGATLD
jgi:hypothetical protein